MLSVKWNILPVVRPVKVRKNIVGSLSGGEKKIYQVKNVLVVWVGSSPKTHFLLEFSPGYLIMLGGKRLVFFLKKK